MFALNFKITKILLLAILLLIGCSPEIVEEQITMEKQKSQCSIATDEYEYASESYREALDYAVSRTGKTIDLGELEMAYEEAQRLASYLNRIDKAQNSKKFWCQRVKPNSTLYKVGGYIYLSWEDAHESINK